MGELTAEELITIRRALQAYHVYLMALTDNSRNNSTSVDEIKRIENLFHKIGEIKIP